MPFISPKILCPLITIIVIIEIIAHSAVFSNATDTLDVLRKLSGSWRINIPESRAYNAENKRFISFPAEGMIITIDADANIFEFDNEYHDGKYRQIFNIAPIEYIDHRIIVKVGADIYTFSFMAPDRILCTFAWSGIPEVDTLILDRYDRDAPLPAVLALQGSWVFDLDQTMAQYHSSSSGGVDDIRAKIAATSKKLRMEVKVIGKNRVTITFYDNIMIDQRPEDGELMLEVDHRGVLHAVGMPSYNAPAMAVIGEFLYYNDGFHQGDFIFRRRK